LVLALERIADVDLRQSTDQVAEVDLPSVLEDLRIVIMPSLREEDITSSWTLQPDLPPVWADRSNLLQVFLALPGRACFVIELSPVSQPNKNS
jgi:hypothetical protein